MSVDERMVERIGRLIINLLNEEDPDPPEALTALGMIVEVTIRKGWDEKDRDKVVDLFVMALRLGTKRKSINAWM